MTPCIWSPQQIMVVRLIIFWIFYIILLVEKELTAALTGPRNVAVIKEDRVTFNCSTSDTSTKLRWSARLNGNGERVLTREGRVLPTYEHEYFVNSSNGHFDLVINKTNSSHAGRYICLELSTSYTASAELTIVEPNCSTTNLQTKCVVSYEGTLKPNAKLILHRGSPDDHRNDRLNISYDFDPSSIVCAMSFGEENVQSLVAENVNSVQGTIARNIPKSVYTNCSLTPPISSKGIQILASLPSAIVLVFFVKFLETVRSL